MKLSYADALERLQLPTNIQIPQDTNYIDLAMVNSVLDADTARETYASEKRWILARLCANKFLFYGKNAPGHRRLVVVLPEVCDDLFESTKDVVNGISDYMLNLRVPSRTVAIWLRKGADYGLVYTADAKSYNVLVYPLDRRIDQVVCDPARSMSFINAKLATRYLARLIDQQ